jgi:hypothetical protein
MTETQAKSGVTGASTDEADAPVDTTPSTDDSKTTTAAPEPSAGSSPSTSDKGTSDKLPSGPSLFTPSSSGLGSSSSSAAVGSGSRVGKDADVADDAKSSEPTVRTPGDGSSPVPVIAGPSSGYGSARAASGSASVVPPSASHATGTASVSSAGVGPVVARASAPVSGAATALRGASGSAPVVTPSRAASSAVGAARVSDAVRTARATVAGAARGPRRARLHLKRIDPWSVMKFSFAVSLVLFVVAIVATSVLYLALDAMGVFTSLNQAMAEITGDAGGPADTFKITAKGVIGTSVLLGAVNMVLFTALMTLAAFVYNVCADLVGGIELTLSEKE